MSENNTNKTGNINYRVTPLNIEQEVAIVTDYNAGMPIAEIMEKHEISKMTLYRVLKRVVKRSEGGDEEDASKQENEEQGEDGGGSGDSGDTEGNSESS